MSTRTSLLLVSGLVLLFTATASASWVQGAFNPVRTANQSDVIVHGTVTGIQQTGGVPTPSHETTHPVTLAVHEVLKGNVTGRLTVQVGGSRNVWISTAASFSMGEEVIVLLQRHEASGRTVYYPTSGQPGKYTVVNGTVQLTEPVRKRITVEDMKTLLRHPATTNITALPSANASRRYTPPTVAPERDAGPGDGPGFLGRLIRAFIGLFV